MLFHKNIRLYSKFKRLDPILLYMVMIGKKVKKYSIESNKGISKMVGKL